MPKEVEREEGEKGRSECWKRGSKKRGRRKTNLPPLRNSSRNSSVTPKPNPLSGSNGREGNATSAVVEESCPFGFASLS